MKKVISLSLVVFELFFPSSISKKKKTDPKRTSQRLREEKNTEDVCITWTRTWFKAVAYSSATGGGRAIRR
jgi:hypothetical protein